VGKSAPGYALRGFPRTRANHPASITARAASPDGTTLNNSRLNDEWLKPLGKVQRAPLGILGRAPTSHIIKKLNLLDGICPEAAELLRDQTFSANLGAVLRKLKPTRQVECVELMVSANNITVAYAQALVAATPNNLLVGETKPKKMTGVSADQMAKMEREMGNLQEQFKLAEQTYGQDILNLVLAKGYLAKLMANEAILRHLTRNHPDVLNEFDSIVRMVALDK
jgi:hypothetical protein